ncbi:hypothetical protein V8E36_002489 [Tilletia maclaganii]
MLPRSARSVCHCCQRSERLLAHSFSNQTRPAAAPAASSPKTEKALSKARSLPETAAAPFSLQPAVVDAAYANARRRNFPVQDEWRTTLERARAELPGMAEEMARLKKTLSRDPRKKVAPTRTTTEGVPEGDSADPATLKQRLRALTQEHVDLVEASLDVRLRFPNGTHAEVPTGPEPHARVVGFGDKLGLLPPELHSALLEAIPCAMSELPDTPTANSARAHTELAAQLRHQLFPFSSALDQASGALTTCASFPFLLGPLATLSQALSAYALRICAKHGFLIVRAPDVIKADLARRCGFMPRDEGEASQTYFVSAHQQQRGAEVGSSSPPELCLAGTAEIPLAGLCADRTFFLNQGGESSSSTSSSSGSGSFLPLKLCALGSAFRAEAGARGADTKGLYRVHQFDKVEMFVVAPAKAEQGVLDGSTASPLSERQKLVQQQQQQQQQQQAASSFAAEDADMALLDELRVIQEEVISGLGLPYRVLDMPTEELGASACRKYDIEAWMPGRGSWGEISSASHCTTFQSRRLNIRYRRSPGAQGKLAYAHTLNATAAAIPRLIVALLENFGLNSGADGTAGPRMRLPDVLRPYWIGAEEEVEWVKVMGSAE